MYKPQYKTSNKGVPILKDSDIDYFAEAFLKDFKPGLLSEPQEVDIEDFSENYLGLVPAYIDLTSNRSVLGKMVFNNTKKIPIYRPDLHQADYITAKRGTMLIDNSLLEEKTEYRLRSTTGHECGHWILQQEYYTVNPYQISFFPELRYTSTACRCEDIEGNCGKRELETEHDWLEHQAKVFSAAILMPKSTFSMVAKDPQLRQMIRNDCCGFEEDQFLADYLSEVFNVSPASAKIRLTKLGLSMDEEVKQMLQQGQQNIFYMATEK